MENVLCNKGAFQESCQEKGEFRTVKDLVY